MKREEQIRMLLHPEKYTEEELARMLDDTNIPVPDANEEWEKFSNQLEVKREEAATVSRSWFVIKKIAAIFIGVLMVSGITYAAVHIIRSISQTKQEQTEIATETNTQRPALETTFVEQDSTLLKPVVFEDKELVTMLNEMATYYKYKVTYRNEDTKHVRLYFTWDKNAKIDDVIQTLNKFERINIIQENQELIVE